MGSFVCQLPFYCVPCLGSTSLGCCLTRTRRRGGRPSSCWACAPPARSPSSHPTFRYFPFLGIPDIWLRIRIPETVPLTGSDSFFGDLKVRGCKKSFFSHFFLITCPQEIEFLLILCKIFILQAVCSTHF
jgi:hypothetical protein